jgi:hypothetical protein
MTDYLNRFGANTAVSGNAGGTAVFADILDFGPIDVNAAMQSHRTGEAAEETVVFRSTGAYASLKSVQLEDCDDAAGTFTTLVTLAAAAPTGEGDFAFIPFPKTHKRYVRASAVTTAAITAGVISARMEPGTAKPRG